MNEVGLEEEVSPNGRARGHGDGDHSDNIEHHLGPLVRTCNLYFSHIYFRPRALESLQLMFNIYQLFFFFIKFFCTYVI